MRGETENRAEKYIKNHNNHKRWMAFALCLSLVTGTITLYGLNKPATAMTEEGAGQVGLVLETADDEFEQGIIEQMQNDDGENEEISTSLEDKEDGAAEAASEEESGNAAVEASSGESTDEQIQNEENTSKDDASDNASSSDASTSSSDASNSSSSEEKTLTSSSASTDASMEKSAVEASSEASSGSSLDGAKTASSAASASSSSASSASEEKTKNIEYIDEYSITATLVDEFGEELDPQKYTGIDLPVFDGVLVLNDVENPPYENVKVKTGLFRTAVYSYVEAIADNKIITGIKKETVEGYVRDSIKKEEISDSAAAFSNSSEDEVKEPELSEVTVYSYTTDGEEYIPFEKDTVVRFVYSLGTQTEFEYEDTNSGLKIMAKLQVPGAVPDDAELVVTPVTEDTTGYNYDAYIDALNDNAEIIANDAGLEDTNVYDDSNTLMYDIAFMYEGQEIQPADGSVSISFEFTNNQLTNDLLATSEKDITVVHLPIKDEVKEQSEITCTSEATEIKSDDIEVKTITDAIAEVGNVDKVEFSENSFSVFVFVTDKTQANTWNGKKNITLNDFSDISSLFYYSVVANNLITDSHIEGNVRTGTFTTNGGAAVLNQGNNMVTQNPITEIDIVKNVVNGYDGKFKFGFFDESGNMIGHTFEIQTSNLEGTLKIQNTDSEYSQVFTSLNNGAVLHVYEIDGDDNKVEEGEQNGTYNVSYSYSDILGNDSLEISNDHDTNYIGEFSLTTNYTTTVGLNFFGTNDNYIGQELNYYDGKLYFGNSGFGVNGLNSEQTYFEYMPGLKEQIASDIENAKDVSVSLADAKNYESGSNHTSNVVNVINLVSTSGNFKKDLEAANFSSPYISGLISEDQYLLINIAVDGDTYYLDGSEVKFDGVNPQDGYNDLGSRVILNFVNAKRTETYSGTIKVSSNAAGLILAPGATVDQSNGQWQGQIIGNVVKHSGQEIHKKTILSGKAVTVYITNTAPTTSITVKKEWNGGDRWAYVYAYVCGRAGSTDVYGKVVQLSEDNGWTATIEDLPVYDSNGTLIIYRAVEIGQIISSIDDISYTTDSNGKVSPENLLYDENAAGTFSEEYEGYKASYSSDLSRTDILNEINKDSVTGSERIGAVGTLSGTVTITNTCTYSKVSLLLKKYLDGIAPENEAFTFSVYALENNGTLAHLADDVTNDKGEISYETQIKSSYVITKSDGEKNVYFIIKENAPTSSQYTKDDSYIIAKVKDLGKESQYLNYYRVADASERTNVDADPGTYVIKYANSEHTISGDDIAFYNKSYSLTIKKEWFYSDGAEVPKEIYDTYTPVNIAVWQKSRVSDPVIYTVVTLSAANNWECTLYNVPRDWGKGQYVYYIQEYDYSGNLLSDSNVVGYYKISNGNASSITGKCDGVDIRGNEDSGTLVLVCRNIRQNYSLPETGGIGRLPFELSGALLTIIAILGLCIHLFMQNKEQYKIQKERTRMKGLKKLLTGILAGAMALSMAFSTGNALKAEAADYRITVKNASKGQSYTLYKLFDYEPSATSDEAGVYKVTDEGVKEFLKSQTDYVKVDANGYVSWANKDNTSDTNGKDTAVAAFAKNVQTAIKDGTLKLTAVDTAEANDKESKATKLSSKDSNGVEQYKIVFSVSEYGYYLVSSTLGALVSIDTTSPEAEVYEKNTTPTIDKQVEEDSASGTYGDKNDAQIGQVVKYQVTVNAKAGGTNYKIHDLMAEGLTFDPESFVVTGLPADVTYTVVTETTDGDTFDVVFNGTFAADATITVAYSALVNEKAVVSTGLVNDTYLEYNNKATTEHDSTETYVYAFNLYKNDGKGTALAGAKFEMKNGDEALAFVYEKKDESGVYVFRVASAEEAENASAIVTKDANGNVVAPVLTAGVAYKEIITPESGKVFVRGLDADSYTLTETEAPVGYNLLTEPKAVIVKRAEEVINGKYLVNDAGNEVSIVNNTGSLLPSTGGMGTTLFYIFGAVLIIAGAAYFIVRRKADAE